MNTNITDEVLIDYLSGAIGEAESQAIEKAVAADPTLEQRLAALQQLQRFVVEAEDEQVSAQAEDRFAAFLATAIDNDTPIRKLNSSFASRWLKVAAVAASVVFVFLLGLRFGRQEQLNDERQLAATRSLMLELMKADKTSDRIEAATVTWRVETADPALVENLGYLLLNDENTNVQLAALGALKRFAQDPLVREKLLAAVASEQQPEVVRLQLIETLVSLKEERVLPYLEKFINNQSLPQHLKDAAQMGKFKLI